MPLQLALLTLLLHAAPQPSSPYASMHFEGGTTQQQLSSRYKPGNTPDGTPWVANPDFVPLMTQVREGKPVGPLVEADAVLLRELDAFVQVEPPEKGRWYSIPPPTEGTLPENLEMPSYMEPLLHLGEVKLSKANGQGGQLPRGKFGPRSGRVLSNLLVLEGSATEVKKVYFTYTRVSVSRTMRKETTHALALLEGGRLQRLVTLEKSMHDLGQRASAVSVTVPTYTQGKMSRIETTRLVDREGDYDYGSKTGISVEKTVFEALTRS